MWEISRGGENGRLAMRHTASTILNDFIGWVVPGEGVSVARYQVHEVRADVGHVVVFVAGA